MQLLAKSLKIVFVKSLAQKSHSLIIANWIRKWTQHLQNGPEASRYKWEWGRCLLHDWHARPEDVQLFRPMYLEGWPFQQSDIISTPAKPPSFKSKNDHRCIKRNLLIDYSFFCGDTMMLLHSQEYFIFQR